MFSKPRTQAEPMLLDMGEIHVGFYFIRYPQVFLFPFLKLITGHTAEDELLLRDQIT